MRGPFLPLYGSGAVMMLLVSRPFQGQILLVYIAGCIGATILEYVTGVIMEALFKVRYWDYTGQPFNFQGRICLGSSLAWGLLTVLMTRFMHKPVEALMYKIPSVVLTVIVVILTLYIVCDFALSFKAAMDLRDILVKLEKAKEDIVRIQKRLDVVIAVTGEEIEQRKEAWEQRKDELEDELRKKLHVEEWRESIKSRLDKGVGGIIKRNMIRSNPTMYSVKYKEAFEELRQRVNSKKK